MIEVGASRLVRNLGVGAAGLYLLAFGLLTFIAFWSSKETKYTNLDKVEEIKITVDNETISP